MGITAQIVMFLGFFFSLYGLMHLYICKKILSQTNFPGAVNIYIVIFLALMVVSPVLCRVCATRRVGGVTYIITLISFLWMGFVYYLFLINAAVDLINMSGKLTRLVTSGAYPFLIVPKDFSTFVVTLFMTACICTYAYFEALKIGVTRVTIQTPKLPKDVDELVIAQISDLHLGVLVGKRRLEKVTRILKEIKPDIIFSTGDLVDANVNILRDLAEKLRNINPRLGKYAVTGNHEFFAGIEQSVLFTRDSGFVLLRNERITLNGLLNIVGLDDPMARTFKSVVGEKPSGLLARNDPNLFTILLYHQPRNFRENAHLLPIDLQLSGHTHKGQLFPFNLVTHLFFPLQGGFFNIGGKMLYISRGTGTWGPPLRFLSPPEIVVIKLKNEAPAVSSSREAFSPAA